MNKFWKVPLLDYVGNRNQLLNNSLHCNIETILKFARSNICNLLLVYDFNQIIWLKDFKSSKNFKSWNNSRHHIFSIFYPQLGSWANVNTQLCKIVIYLFPSLCISPDSIPVDPNHPFSPISSFHPLHRKDIDPLFFNQI